MLRTKLILERLDKEGRVLERREQRSKSFVLQLMDLLYCRHTQANRDIRDISNTVRSVSFSQESNHNLGIVSPGGLAGCARDKTSRLVRLMGQNVGIQVGRGNTAVTPTDYKMDDRIEHGLNGKTGVTAEFLNPSFETGDLTSWIKHTDGNFDATVESDAWALKDGTYFVYFQSTGAIVVGEYAEIEQDINLDNITAIRFQMRGSTFASPNFDIQVLIDGRPVYRFNPDTNTDYADQIIDVRSYFGVHTVTFKVSCRNNYGTADRGIWIDHIETLQGEWELEYGGMEVIGLTFSDPDGEFTIRRYFTNRSGQSITVEEVGIQAKGEIAGDVFAFLIARDLTGGIAVANTQILRATYVPQITV